MILFFKLILSWIFKLPIFLTYHVYDKSCYYYYRLYMLFYGWGIRLYVGKFGQGKTSAVAIRAYELAKKYPQLTILTNMELKNFPTHTKILKLNTAQDILNAPTDCLVLIDEIGTIFNSRDFSSGKNAVPKVLFQHLCQCRKRRLMILATVQRFNLLDKQIRDISATVTSCKTSFTHPFSRMITLRTFDIDEYEAYQLNPTYAPRLMDIQTVIQTNRYRQLYDTTGLIDNMLSKEYLSDEEILVNRGETQSIFGDKETQKMMKKRKRY